MLPVGVSDGSFYDLFGSGFVFADSEEYGLVAMVADPEAVCTDLPSASNVSQAIGALNLSPANVSRDPRCKGFFGARKRDLQIWFGDTPEQEASGVLTYRPRDVNWQLTVTLDGLLIALTVFDYLALFWDDRGSQILVDSPADSDYETFAQYFCLLSDLDAAGEDPEEIAVQLADFRDRRADATQSSDRIRILADEITAYYVDRI